LVSPHPPAGLTPAVLPAVLVPVLAACRGSQPAPTVLPREGVPLRPSRETVANPSPGVYFLHEAEFGVDRCALVAVRVSGGTTPQPPPGDPQARARAVLDLAEQARWMGRAIAPIPMPEAR
ncbi:MAG: hypothetical protein IIA40_03915, partial [SAR324 cluster bacterium]|nr:hypothetical protein [SAR324 cluster bacterium]